MIRPEEIVRALKGSWRLLLGEKRAMAWFDTSIEGFWRSFGVMILTLPAPLLELSARRLLPAVRVEFAEEMQGPLYWTAGILAYVAAWIVFPIVVALLARRLRLTHVYVPYMVVRNWTSILAVAPSFFATLLYYLGLLPEVLLGLLNSLALLFALYYSWRVTRIACAASMSLAAGLVALDFLLTWVIYGVADRLIGL
jgi:hypothetical protein